MKPDVNQHLQSMAKALAEIVLPELVDKPFAYEQASLILGSLKLLGEVQDHQFAYVKQEFADTRSLLGTWFTEHPQSADTTFWQALHADTRATHDIGFAELRDILAREKSALRTLMDGPRLSGESRISALMSLYVERQLARETAWLRQTGFIPNATQVPHVSAVLEQQARIPLQC